MRNGLLTFKKYFNQCMRCCRLCAVITLIALAIGALLVTLLPAFGGLGLSSLQKSETLIKYFRTPVANVIFIGLLVCFASVSLLALVRRRWISALFHLGAALLIVGGGLTAGYAKESQCVWVEPQYAQAPYQYISIVGGERVALQSFQIERYANNMPKQYRSVLIFPDGPQTLSVNHPIRRNGLAFYQMSYDQWGTDAFGAPIYRTIIVVRKDPGAIWIYSAYGVLILAAGLLMIRELRK